LTTPFVAITSAGSTALMSTGWICWSPREPM
jgi:hypothetical protein